MSNWVNNYSEEDITDVYSAIISAQPRDVAMSLFQEGGVRPNTGSTFVEKRSGVCASRVKAILRIIRSLQPNFECSGQEPLRPWSASSLACVKGKCWPNVLGMRIVIPKGASKMQKAHMISNLLTNMTAIR